MFNGTIGIDMGHKENTGAYMETYYNRLVGKKLMEMFKEKGYNVVNCTSENTNVDNQLAEIVHKSKQVNLLLSLHCNAFNGQAEGVEVYVAPRDVYGSQESYNVDYTLASDLCKNISNIGYRNRGVKNERYYVLVNALCRGVLIEMFFSDNPNERNKFNLDKMCNAIFKSVTGKDYTGNSKCPTCGK